MDFKSVLNDYIEKIDCTGAELAKCSSISPAVISRYRKGERIPKYKSEQFDSLVNALMTISKEKNVEIDESKLNDDLESTLDKEDIDSFVDNFNVLIETLKINVADMARYIGYDASFISKIRKGIRKPQNTTDFINGVCKYIVNYYNDSESKSILATLFGVTVKDLENNKDYYNAIISWISCDVKREDTNISSFLNKLDEFDLNEYIKSIKFDEIKVPTMPISLPKSKDYYGIEGFKESQIDVLKSIVLSKSLDDVFFYSNMPMIEGSNDLEFTKKFMIGLAFMLKKGLKLNIVHNLDRPFNEIMLGLEGWIPLYMTGQISPYYFKNSVSSIYSNIECIGGSVMMSGKSLKNDLKTAEFHLTNKSNVVDMAHKRAKELLKKANPLMDIYRDNDKNNYLKEKRKMNGNKRNILTSLPIYIMSSELLEKVLNDNGFNAKDKKIIMDYYNFEKENISNILKDNIIYDEINIETDGEIYISLADIFYENKLSLSNEDYSEYKKLLAKFKKTHNKYNYSIDDNTVFKNINISIIDNKTVIISKGNAPTIHFIIHHAKLVNAIDNFQVSIVEK